MTCGGEIHNAPETNRKLCTRLGLDYMGTAEIVMPENYIALFSTPNSTEEVNHILAAAVPALEQTAAAIESGCPVTEPKPTVFGKFMTYIVNPIFYATCVHDRAFTVDDSCIGCGKCATLCPMNNIELQGGKPQGSHRLRQKEPHPPDLHLPALSTGRPIIKIFKSTTAKQQNDECAS